MVKEFLHSSFSFLKYCLWVTEYPLLVSVSLSKLLRKEPWELEWDVKCSFPIIYIMKKPGSLKWAKKIVTQITCYLLANWHWAPKEKLWWSKAESCLLFNATWKRHILSIFPFLSFSWFNFSSKEYDNISEFLVMSSLQFLKFIFHLKTHIWPEVSKIAFCLPTNMQVIILLLVHGRSYSNKYII